MPRPQRQSLSYFPLDTDFFHTKHIRALRREHGTIGILTYLSILCKVYGTGGYYYTFHDRESLCMDIAEDLANLNMPTVYKRVDGALHYLVKQTIFDERLFLQNVITGKALQEQFIISAHKLRWTLKMDAYLLVDVNEVLQKNGFSVTETEVSVTETGVSVTDSTQKKGKEKKEKEIKSTITLSLPDNVRLTPEQYLDIEQKIPNAKQYVTRFATKLSQMGYRYPDHHKAILDWWEQDCQKESNKACVGSFKTDDFEQIAMQNSMQIAKRKGACGNGKK